MMKRLLPLLLLLIASGCSKDDSSPAIGPPPAAISDPMLNRFVFEASKNPKYLIDDVECTISGSEISGLVPYVTDISRLIPTFGGDFKSVAVGPAAQTSGVTANDFTSKVAYRVTSEDGRTQDYDVTLFAFTGLPVVTVWTTDRREITSKEDYVDGTVSISKTADFPKGYGEGRMGIRGRGNATWFSYPKKAYRIKLKEKSDMLGMPSDKDWVLLANYCDKSLIRLSIGFRLSEMMSMPWTPRTEFVELFLNGQYNGTYLFGEHVKVSKDRLNIDEKTGYLIEHDNYYAQEPIYFTTANRGYHYTFKNPDVTAATDPAYTYILDYMNRFEQALYSADFANPVAGYRSYIDAQNFADWYIIQSVLSNKDTNRYYFKSDNQSSSKLGMAPVWDFEWSLGIGWNDKGPADPAEPVQRGYYFDQLKNDPYFCDLVRQRWTQVRDQYLPELYLYINEIAQRVSEAQKANFRKWNILNTTVSVEVITPGTWENEVSYLKDFLTRRIQYLDSTPVKNW